MVYVYILCFKLFLETWGFDWGKYINFQHMWASIKQGQEGVLFSAGGGVSFGSS